MKKTHNCQENVVQKLGPNQRKFINALKSGKYRQGKNYLREGDLYCCFGIAAEISGIVGVRTTVTSKIDYHRDGSFNKFLVYAYEGLLYLPPDSVWKDFLALRDSRGSSKDSKHRLVGMNDVGITFHKIAMILEQDPSNFFVESR